MKNSNLLIFIVLVVIVMAIQNQNKKVFKARNIDTGKVEAYHEPIGNSLYRTTEESFEKEKQENLTKMLLIGGGAILVLGFITFYLKSGEDKVDPIKNLNNLKAKEIITQTEFDQKVLEARDIESKKRIEYENEKQTKKLFSELENLKEKGIISQIEFDNKKDLIRKKFNS